MYDQDETLLKTIVAVIGDDDLYVDDLGHCNYSIVSRRDVAASEGHEHIGVTNFDGYMYADRIDGSRPTTGPSLHDTKGIEGAAAWVRNIFTEWREEHRP